MRGFAEGEGFFGAAAYVVRGFRQEERLAGAVVRCGLMREGGAD